MNRKQAELLVQLIAASSGRNTALPRHIEELEEEFIDTFAEEDGKCREHEYGRDREGKIICLKCNQVFHANDFEPIVRRTLGDNAALSASAKELIASLKGYPGQDKCVHSYVRKNDDPDETAYCKFCAKAMITPKCTHPDITRHGNDKTMCTVCGKVDPIAAKFKSMEAEGKFYSFNPHPRQFPPVPCGLCAHPVPSGDLFCLECGAQV